MLYVYAGGSYAGTFADEGGGISTFAYDPSYTGPDLSIRFPRTEASARFTGRDVTNWFYGLLPDEEDTRRAMAAIKATEQADVFSLLRAFGKDCPGAVQVVSDNDTALATADDATAFISTEQIAGRLRLVMAPENPWVLDRESWSLGGTQGKIALRLTESGWARCIGRAATTHIVKPGVSGLSLQSVDEHFSMRLAACAHLPVARTWIEDFDGIKAIVAERYDRVLNQDGSVTRLHQEDLCQAFGINPECKYVSDGGPSANAIMRLFEGDASQQSVRLFMRALCLNHLIGATDGHAKNYSLLHMRGSDFILAPLYDVASALPYFSPNRRTYRTAMSIGGENRIGWMRKGPLDRFDRVNGLEAGTMRGVMLEVAYALRDNADGVIERASNELGDMSVAGLTKRLVPRLHRLLEGTIRAIDTPGAQFTPVQICGDES